MLTVFTAVVVTISDKVLSAPEPLRLLLWGAALFVIGGSRARAITNQSVVATEKPAPAGQNRQLGQLGSMIAAQLKVARR